MKFIVTPEIRDLGINAYAAVIRIGRISNKNSLLENKKREAVEKIKLIDLTGNKILQGYRELYEDTIFEGQIPSAEYLIQLVKKSGRLPNINTVVDCYNLISAETMLGVGAHDTAHLKGDAAFRLTDGSEKYTPLGGSQPQKVNAGEYACMDEEKIICRMDVRQCNETKITKQTTEFMVYVQGNKYVDDDYLQNALLQVCKLIQQVCGGDYNRIDK